MAITIVATPGAANANSYETVAEADEYFEGRVPLSPAWEDADSKEALLVMATRTLDAMFQGRRILYKDDCDCEYYITGRRWTGAPASSTQRLAWPRTGMFDQNGNAIPSNVIPQALKDAESELAGQLGVTDRTLDSDASVEGIKSVRAGSVAVEFRDRIKTTAIPDAVLNLMPPSWFTDEVYEEAHSFEFEVVD